MIAALDFSMRKTALTISGPDILDIYVFPGTIDKMSEIKLKSVNVNIISLNTEPIHAKQFDESTLIVEHVKRANDLANKISHVIKSYCMTPFDLDDFTICNEGFSYASKGSASLDIVGYKYILMNTLMNDGFSNFITYSPATIKKTAGCSFKGSTKLDMISAAANLDLNHAFISALRDNPSSLKKKTCFIPCVDDIVDSLFCCVTNINQFNSLDIKKK